MIEQILLSVGIIALGVNIFGFFRLLNAKKAFLSGWYQTIIRGVFFIVGFLVLFILVDVLADYVFYFTNDIELYKNLNLALFIAALLTTLSLVIISLINIKIAKEHGFK